jgi:ankyrin repeat protein
LCTIVELFLEKGFDVNFETTQFKTALHCAVSMGAGDEVLARLILENGEPDLNIVDANGFTALDRSLDYVENCSWDFRILLAEHGARINSGRRSPMMVSHISHIQGRIAEILPCSAAIFDKCSGRIAQLITEFSFGMKNLKRALKDLEYKEYENTIPG